jgi:predicted house-cleaning noncanonical NTP pyrophosphatase (MazG superfamily)
VELDLEQQKLKLKEKLLEEATEVSQASNVDDIKVELADVLEVITALMYVYDITADEVNEVRLKKASINGVFDSKCFINYIEVALDNKPVIDYMENKNRPYKLII